LVGDFAGLLNARGDVGNQLGLRAVAGEIGQSRATIAGQGRDEAVELSVVSEWSMKWMERSYRASGNVRKLGVGQAGSNEGNQSVRELHVC
jgi:hypothetical protein